MEKYQFTAPTLQLVRHSMAQPTVAQFSPTQVVELPYSGDKRTFISTILPLNTLSCMLLYSSNLSAVPSDLPHASSLPG